MNAIYLIKNDKIYQIQDEEKAIEIEIVDGVATQGKKTIEYDKNDMLYTFFEIKAKFSSLFEIADEDFEDNEEFNKIIQEKEKTIAALKAKVKELENIIESSKVEETSKEETKEEETKEETSKE